MSRARSTIPKELSPRLVRVIEAARHARHGADGADISGVPRALEEFGVLARWVVPVHGLFVPNHTDVAIAIERIATRYLALEPARRQFREAIGIVEAFEQRDSIASAQNFVQEVCEEAYFYAGLAVGVTLVDFT